MQNPDKKIVYGLSSVETTNNEAQENIKLEKNLKLLNLIFPSVDFSGYEQISDGEIQVISPIPRDFTSNGQPIYEQQASASVNVEKGLFVDFTLIGSGKMPNGGCTIEELFKRVHRFPKQSDARKVISYVTEPKLDWNEWKTFEESINHPTNIKKLEEFHINLETAKLYHCGIMPNNQPNQLFTVPVVLFGKIIDARTYVPKGSPKVKSLAGAPAGMMVGKEIWEQNCVNDMPTIICAGEKDMLSVASLGYNAITFTGGEANIPRLWGSLFTNKKVYIAYDNDETGKKGSLKLAMFLKEHNADVYIINLHHTDENLKDIVGGDMWDAIHKYGKNAKEWIDAAIAYAIKFDNRLYNQELEKEVPLIPLYDVTQPEHLGQLRQSIVQALNDTETTYSIPTAVEGTKIAIPGKSMDRNELRYKEQRFWELNDYNTADLLYMLQDYKQKDMAIRNQLLKVSSKEENFVVYEFESMSISKTTIMGTDNSALENADRTTLASIKNIELPAFVLNYSLVAGKKYKIVYRYVPNPLKQQQAILMIHKVEELDSLGGFKLTEEVKDNIKQIQNLNLSIRERLEFHFQQLLSRIKVFNNFDLWLITMFVFNTPLNFVYTDQVQKAHLDIILIGESRTGKSVMSEALIKLYKLGKKINADSSTTQALLGGTVETSTGTKVRYGALARENGGLVVLEELKDIAKELIPKLRSLRSQSILKVVRVASSLETYLSLRLLMITNPIVPAGSSLDLRNNFNDGLEALSSVIYAPEDKTRFDLVFLVDHPDNLERQTPDPFEYKYVDKVPDEWYQQAIRFVWTRDKNQVKFDEGVEHYIYKQGKNLSQRWDTMDNIYGTEAPIKLARLSIALASTLLDVDSTFESILVRKEHVDFIYDWLIEIYEGDLFRYNKTVAKQKVKKESTVEDLQILSDISNGDNKGSGIKLLELLRTIGAEGISTDQLFQQSGIEARPLFDKYYGMLSNAKFIEFSNKYKVVKVNPKLKVTLFTLDAQKEVNKQKQENLNIQQQQGIQKIQEEWEIDDL